MKKAQLKELIKKSHMKEGSTVPWLNQDKNNSEDTLDTLEAKLKAHNWFHYQSDGRVYDEGMAQKREIQGILKNLESKGLIAAAKELYNKYAPYEEGSFDLRLTEEGKQDDENHKHIYKQIDPDGTAECTICGLRNSDPSKTGEKVVAESTWSTGTYTEIKRFVSDLDMLKDKYYNIVGSDDVFDGLDRAATAAEELMRNAPENKGELAEDYYPSVRAYNVIDGDRNIVYKNLPRHTAIEKAGEREDYKFTATDSLAEDKDEDVVKYKGEDHVITRRDGDRIYLRRKEDAAILGKMPEFWVKSQDINEDLDVGHEDNEPHMLKADLYRIGKYAMELYQMMDEFEGKGEVDFPHWWQSKIINAKSNLVGAKHYLDFEIKEPAIDAVVDRISDVAPEMEIDGVNEAARTYWHVIEDVDGERGHQGVYGTREEAEKEADRLSDMFFRSFFYVEASDSEREPVDITLEETSYDTSKDTEEVEVLMKTADDTIKTPEERDEAREKAFKLRRNLKEVKNSVLSKLLGTKG